MHEASRGAQLNPAFPSTRCGPRENWFFTAYVAIVG